MHVREWLASCVGADVVGLADSARSRFASVMMCHFEMMASSSPDGWMNHIEAAAGMLERLGPENCRLGLEHEMFLTVRLFMVRLFSVLLYPYCLLDKLHRSLIIIRQ